MKNKCKESAILSLSFTLIAELLQYLGLRTRVPVVEKYSFFDIEYYINVTVEFIAFFIVILLLLCVVEKNEKYVREIKDREYSKTSNPILDKIIEGAMSGKTTDDILKTQNDDSETEKEVDDDNKEYQ